MIMKISTKLFTATGCLLVSAAAINKIIFKNVQNKSTKTDYKTYKWKFGDIAYHTMGSGEPLLLVHSIIPGASHLEWKNNIDALSEYNKLYIIDLLGFGDSSNPAITYSSYIYTQLINDFIKDVIEEPVNISAASNSASFAVMAYKFHPENFKKMLLISPDGISSSNSGSSNSDSRNKFVMETPLIGTSIYNALNSKPLLKSYLCDKVYYRKDFVTDEILNRYYCSAHKNGADSKYPIAALISNYLSINIETAFAEIEVPVFVLWGENNELNPVSGIEKAKKLNENINFGIFDETRLLPHEEKAEEFNILCKNFFNDVISF